MVLELISGSNLVFKGMKKIFGIENIKIWIFPIRMCKGPFNVVSTTTLKLCNNGNDRLAFKMKTTVPKRYCVKPNAEFLNPDTIMSVQSTAVFCLFIP